MGGESAPKNQQQQRMHQPQEEFYLPLLQQNQLKMNLSLRFCTLVNESPKLRVFTPPGPL
jgi:hypothetical protein